MTISLVIPAYNEEAYIGPCLDAAIHNGEGKYKEIIVVDNASTDKTAEIARSYPGVTVVHEARPGTSNARQTGAEHAQGDILAYMDADSRMPAEWIDSIEHAFTENPRLALLSGPYYFYDAPWYRKWILHSLWWFSPITYRIVGYVVLAGNMAIRKSMLDTAGGHDRTLQFYGDEVALAQRLRPLGELRYDSHFVMGSSARRFNAEGVLRTHGKNLLNFIWPFIFGHPFTEGYHAFREKN